MIISNKAAIQRVAQIYQEQKQGERARKKSTNVAFNDRVSLSTEGKEMQALLQKVKDAPSISPKAEEIKLAVKSGTYEVSPKQIAQGLLKSWGRS